MKPRRLLASLSGIVLVCVLLRKIFGSENIYNLVHLLSVQEMFPSKIKSSYITQAHIYMSSNTNTNSTKTTSTTTTSTKTTSTTTTSTKNTSTTTSRPTTKSSTITNPEYKNSTWTTTPISMTPKVLFLTTRFHSRMGNHMFIYAALVGLAKAQGREPFMNSGDDLESLFQLSHIRKDIKTDNWAALKESGNYAKFDSKFMKLPQQNMIIYGCFQCWRYFQHAKEEIRREFTFKAEVQKKVQTILETYRNRRENHVLVAVHVRRGDFATPYNAKRGFGVASASYFVNAFAKIRSLLTNQNITFLVGSDDLDWCKTNLNDTGIEFLPQGSPADHFAILSSCDHTIITSGTYGWWIGWLSDGVTIYYKNYIIKGSRMYHGFSDSDYYPLGWIGLDN